MPPQQQQQAQPIVNNYYYGMPPEPETPEEKVVDNKIQESTPHAEQVSFQEEEEVEYDTYASPDPRLKFRFA